MSEKRLYVRVRGRVIGPFSLAQLKALRERGQFHRFHEVSEDRKRWVSAATLEELFADGAESVLAIEPTDARPGTAAAAPRTDPATEWFYVDAQGNQAGPVSQDQLLSFARAGTIKGETLVWKEGLANWMTLAETGLLAGQPPSAGADSKSGRRGDGLTALKDFLLDPVGGLPPLCDSLGNTGSLALGLVFCVVFDLCVIIAALLANLDAGHVTPWQGLLFGQQAKVVAPGGLAPAAAAPTPADKIALLWKIAVTAVLPLASLTVAILVIRLITGGRGFLGYDVLIAGATLLPVGLLLPIVFLIGDHNPEIAIFLVLLSSCLAILILNSGFTRVLRLSDRGAILAIPATLLLDLYLSKEVMKWFIPGM